MKRAKFFILTFFCFLFLTSRAEAGKTYLLNIQGTINPVAADYVSNNLYRASEGGAGAVIIKMDTPGGLMESMRQIIIAMEAADYPVIVYVGPPGARAASAGVFITMASDIAVMAEGTNIGAAHPVKLGGREVGEIISKKMSEDARAYIKALAEKHSRNAAWAQKAVSESLSITSSEALEKNVVEYEVVDFQEMTEILNGRTVVKNDREFTLSLEPNNIVEREMPFFKRFLNYLAHPNIAYIFLILGIYGFIYEFSNPGIGLGAAAGGIGLLLAALALQIIPINVIGVLLIVFGVALMVLDIWVPSFGVLTAGGLVSFVLGSMTLIDVESFNVDISSGLIIGAALALGLFFVFAAGSGLKIQLKKISTGSEGMAGLLGKVQDKLDPEGTVYIHGEIWQARSVDGPRKKGTIVQVKEVRGNLLLVKKPAGDEN